MSDDRPLLPSLDRRRFALGAAFAAAAGVAWARKPRTVIDYLGKRKLDDIIPKKFGGWEFQTSSGLVVPPEDQLSSALYSELITRVYGDDQGRHVMLLIAQSAQQTGVLQVHRPEFCYPAGGYTLSPPSIETISVGPKSIEAVGLTATSRDRTEELLYWTRVGDRMPLSWRQQRLAVAADNLEGNIPDAVLLRASTLSSNREIAQQTMKEFLTQLLAAMPADARKVLIA